MKDLWIDIKIMPIPRNSGRVLLYTPHKDPVIRYRMSEYELSRNLREATHWQPLLKPKQ